MTSEYYQDLCESVENLKRVFLDFGKSEDGDYEKDDLLKCQAFIVLCHSEIEAFIEAIAKERLRRAETNWKERQVCDATIASLLIYRSNSTASPSGDPTALSEGRQLSNLIENAIAKHSTAIAENNGIKKANIGDLFVPLGFQPSDFSEILLLKLESLGKSRGEIAHKRSKISIPNIRDPFDDELKEVLELIEELEGFDQKVLT